MLSRERAKSPGFARLLLGGLAAGVASAFTNNLYFVVYRWATDFHGHEPSFASITLSSLAPSVPAALGYLVLSRLSARAHLIFVSLTAIFVVISFDGLFRQTFPDGAPKPTGFDGAVMPMHVVVGLATALLVPWFARGRAATQPRAVSTQVEHAAQSSADH